MDCLANGEVRDCSVLCDDRAAEAIAERDAPDIFPELDVVLVRYGVSAGGAVTDARGITRDQSTAAKIAELDVEIFAAQQPVLRQLVFQADAQDPAEGVATEVERVVGRIERVEEVGAVFLTGVRTTAGDIRIPRPKVVADARSERGKEVGFAVQAKKLLGVTG